MQESVYLLIYLNEINFKNFKRQKVTQDSGILPILMVACMTSALITPMYKRVILNSKIEINKTTHIFSLKLTIWGKYINMLYIILNLSILWDICYTDKQNTVTVLFLETVKSGLNFFLRWMHNFTGGWSYSRNLPVC